MIRIEDYEFENRYQWDWIIYPCLRSKYHEIYILKCEFYFISTQNENNVRQKRDWWELSNPK